MDVAKKLDFNTPGPRLTIRSPLPPSPSTSQQAPSLLNESSLLNSKSSASISGVKPEQQSPIRYGVPQDDAQSTRRERHSVVKYGIPSDDDSDDIEDEPDIGPGSSSLGIPPSRGLSQASPLEEALQRMHLSLHSKIRTTSQERSSQIHAAFLEAEQKLANDLASVVEHVRKKESDLLRADESLHAAHSKERDQRLKELQRLHEKAAATQQQQVERLQAAKREEERRKAEEERRKREAEEAERRRKEEEEARVAEGRRKEEEAKKKAEEDKAAQAAQAQARAAEDKAKAEKAKAAASDGLLCLTPEASQWRKQVAARLKELQEQVAPLEADDNLKKQRREIEKKMTVHVQQISATTDQVAKKCGDVYNLLASLNDPAWRTYAIIQFCTKVLRQSELVILNNKAAFPLALVLVQLSKVFPDVMAVMLGLLHKESWHTVPLAYQHDAARLSEAQYCKLMRYREVEDKDKPGTTCYESHEEYYKRIEGAVLLYGAMVQVDDPANPHGLDHGWRYLVRLLNRLPADRPTAKALICFLRMAGYAMYHRFKGQFIKLLKCMYDEYLPQLAQSTEPDIQAVRTLLAHYLTNQQFQKEPEGRAMPKVDMSTYTRA